MKGLIYRDLIILYKKTSKISIMAVFLIPIISLFIFKFTAVSLLSILVPLIFGGLSYNLFIEDDKSNWDKYLRTVPLNTKKLVASRYISSIIILSISILYMLIINLITYMLFKEQIITLYFIILGIGAMLAYIYLLIFIPANYFLGATSKNIVSTVFMILVVAIAYIIKNSLSDYYIILFANIPLYIHYILNLVFAILFTTISFYLSLRGFKRKKIF